MEEHRLWQRDTKHKLFSN